MRVSSVTVTGDPPGPSLLVRSVTWEALDVVSLEFVDPEGRELPPWSPGAHIDVHLPSGTLRQYSLCGDPGDRRSYRIAVLREPAGRGGSAEVHDSALVGTRLRISEPRNHFALADAPRYVLIAGGIGITPILPMVGELVARGADWNLHYGGRQRASMAFGRRLEALAPDRVSFLPQDEVGLLDLKSIISDDLPGGTAFYVCGPPPLLAAVTTRCEATGRLGDLHVEHFGRDVTEEISPTGSGFDIVLADSGVTLHVPPDRSILDVAREVVPDLLSSCEEGVCGTCETEVIEGIPEHHDLVLSPAERASNKTMMICVGRCAGDRLVLRI